jgi:phosphatidylinositol glycan class S
MKPTEDHATVKHSPRYRLAFSLLNEDAALGGGIKEWPVDDLIARESDAIASPRHPQTIQDMLHQYARGCLACITSLSRVSFVFTLPWPFHRKLYLRANRSTGSRSQTSQFLSTLPSGLYVRSFCKPFAWQCKASDLKPASSVSNDPVLHFLAFVPSTEHRPLRILDKAGM